MRFLADENMPGSAVRELREAGHAVVWVGETRAGITDEAVLAWAIREERILLTFDKDFGALAASSAIPSTCGVVLFRLAMPPMPGAGKTLANIVLSREDWAGHFSVIERGRLRMRPIAAN